MSDLGGLNLSPEEEAARLKREEWIDFWLLRIAGLDAEVSELDKKIGEQTDRMEAEPDVNTKLEMISDTLDDEERRSAAVDELMRARRELDGALLDDGPTE
jgi:hypothetical protein